jgi:predicted HTH domain antitoxin
MGDPVIWQQYQQDRISAGKAAGLLGMRRAEFEALRIESGISLPFTSEELLHDLDWAACHAKT